ncbi:MAG TPA: M48 family metallopeptidase [Gemmatimonadaceae bacterium]|nr:M48 family metallopeptidase [Gemmatimonadaceae bacterium]
MSPHVAVPTDLNALIHAKERTYQGVVVAVSLIVYGFLLIGLFGAISTAPQVIGVFIGYAILGFVIYAMVRGMMLGHIVGNGVRISPQQLPHLHNMARDAAGRLGMATLPDIYLLQAGGLLNAFATRFFGREFVVLYSEIIDIAGEHGDDAVGFVIAHELAHHQRGHLRKHLMFLPGRAIPFLGQAYSRGCELTCDRYGAACYTDGAVAGLLALAAGTRVHQKVNPAIFAEQVTTEAGFWRSLAEVLSTHPILPRRVLELTTSGMVAHSGA